MRYCARDEPCPYQEQRPPTALALAWTVARATRGGGILVLGLLQVSGTRSSLVPIAPQGSANPH